MIEFISLAVAGILTGVLLLALFDAFLSATGAHNDGMPNGRFGK